MSILRWQLGLALFSVGLVLVSGNPVEACRGRGGSSSCCPTPCYPVWPCPPSTCCTVYRLSEPVEPIDGPYYPKHRPAQVCHGVIVQIDVPAGAPPFPTDLIQVTQSAGTGAMQYVGWNKHVVTPGLPGSPTRYSIFLCPTKAGDCHIDVGLAYSNNTMKSVPFKFTIAP